MSGDLGTRGGTIRIDGSSPDPKRLLLVVPHYLPEIGSASHIYSDLAATLYDRGHEVDVITSYPRQFNVDVHGREEHPIHETIDGVRVHRSVHSSTRDSVVMRGIEHYLIPRHYYRTYCDLNKKFDAAIMYIPPLALYHLAERIKRRDGVPSILNYQDFHPQELTDVGMVKSRTVIMLMERLERKSYQNADYIATISPGGIEYIRGKGCGHERMAYIYNGVALSREREGAGSDFKVRQGMEEKVLLSYAGILSPFQGIDNILNVFVSNPLSDDLILYIIGDGMMRDHIAARIEGERMDNIRLLPLQPRVEYFNIINSSDICLVLLDERMRAPCVPGKLASLMAARKAILAVVPRDSETSRIVTEAGCGIVVEPGDEEGLLKAILQLKGDPNLRAKLGDGGRRFIEREMNLEMAAKKYEAIVALLKGT